MNDFEAALMNELGPLHRGLYEVFLTLQRGRNSHPENAWQRLSPLEHVEHAKLHLEQAAAGDLTEDHVAHAATRLLMALQARG